MSLNIKYALAASAAAAPFVLQGCSNDTPTNKVCNMKTNKYPDGTTCFDCTSSNITSSGDCTTGMGANFCDWVTPAKGKNSTNATCEGKDVQKFFESLKHDDKTDAGVCKKYEGTFKQICKDPCGQPDRQLKVVKFSDLTTFIQQHEKAIVSFLKPADFLGQSIMSGCMNGGGGFTPGPVITPYTWSGISDEFGTPQTVDYVMKVKGKDVKCVGTATYTDQGGAKIQIAKTSGDKCTDLTITTESEFKAASITAPSAKPSKCDLSFTKCSDDDTSSGCKPSDSETRCSASVSENNGLWDLTLIECDGIDAKTMQQLAVAAGKQNVVFSVSKDNWSALDFVEEISVGACLGNNNRCAILPSTQSGKKNQPTCAPVNKICSQFTNTNKSTNMDNCKAFPKTCKTETIGNQCLPQQQDCSFMFPSDDGKDNCELNGCASEKQGSKFVCESDAKCESQPDKDNQCMLGKKFNASGKDAVKNFPCKLVSDGKAYCKPKDQQRID